jgi:outer membrane protein
MAVAAQPVSANDLLDAYGAARTQDAALQAALYQREAAVEQRPQALAAFLPQLNASAGWAREHQDYEVQPAADGATTAAGSGSTLEGFYGNTHNYALTLNQTLWSFESFRRLQEADAQVAQAEATYRSAEQGLVLRVAQAYFGVLSAADALSIDRREREAFGTLLHQAQAREQTGVSPRTDLAEAQSFYDATAQTIVDAENALDDAKRALMVLTTRETDSVASLREEIPLTQPSPATPEEWLRAAREENFDVRAASLKASAAQREVEASRAKYWPTLAMQGSSTRQYEPDSFGGRQHDDRVGVAITWPIFQGGLVQSQLRQTQALAKQAQAESESVARDAERHARAAFRGVTTGVDRIQADRQAVQSGETAVEASRRGVEFGTRSEFDLLNAQTNYYAALRSYEQSRYDYLQARLTLKQLAGRLSVDDLAAIDALLLPAGTSASNPSFISASSSGSR